MPGPIQGRTLIGAAQLVRPRGKGIGIPLHGHPAFGASRRVVHDVSFLTLSRLPRSDSPELGVCIPRGSRLISGGSYLGGEPVDRERLCVLCFRIMSLLYRLKHCKAIPVVGGHDSRTQGNEQIFPIYSILPATQYSSIRNRPLTGFPTCGQTTKIPTFGLALF
jgi:hypothetical protein